MAYNVLAMLKRCVEHAHRERTPRLEVSTNHLAVHLRSDYEGMLIALPASCWQRWAVAEPDEFIQHLLRLAQRTNPKSLATAKRDPKIKRTKSYVEGLAASTHVATARILKLARKTP